MNNKLYIFLVMLVITFPTYVNAQTEKIAAVVNDDVISTSELNDRVRLIMESAGLPNNSEMRSKLSPQILNELIDEKIKAQDAAKNKIQASDAEVESGLKQIAAQNNIPLDKFIKMLQSRGINIDTLRNQVKSQILWSKLVTKKIRPNIEVSDADIDTALSRIKENIGKNEYLVAEIFLPFDKFNKESDAKQLAYRLVGQLNAGAVPFGKLARQFSGSAGADKGGDMGWVQQGQLSKELDKALVKMRNKSVSNPIRGINGYHILLLRDKRKVTKESLPSREQLRQRIGMERLERNARAYFYDLKSTSYIEIR